MKVNNRKTIKEISSIYNRIEKNTLTPEEKKQQAKDKKRIYQREYMKKCRDTDPEFAEKHRECRKKCEKTRYDTDAEYRTTKSNENKERYAKYREAYLKSC